MEQKKISPIPLLPMYIKKVHKVYIRPKLSNFLDNNLVVTVLSFGSRKKLIQALLREIEPKKNVLQIGATFGKQIEEVSQKLTLKGTYGIVDVSHTQYERCKRKYYKTRTNISLINQNGLAKIVNKFDTAISFNLLHELPHISRTKMVNNLLDSVKPGGKVVFIDYHKPEKHKILRTIFKYYNRLYRPFAEEFLERDIASLAKNHDDFTWHKTTIFGDFYQKVVAVKKA